MQWFSNLIRKRSTDWYYATLDEGEPIPANKFYVDIFLRSMRIRDVRKGLRRFAGAVHSFIELPQLASGNASFHTFTVPNDLKAVDPEHLDRVVISSQRLLGPVPYRGGDLSIDLGLFSVQIADLVDDYLGILTDLANAAGVGYVNAALPFVKPIEDGIQRLVGDGGPAALEIGLSEDIATPREGAYLVMRGPEQELKQVNLVHDAQFKVSRADGQRLDYPYLTYEIATNAIRDDWFVIDDLRRAYTTLQTVVRNGATPDTAREQFAVFRAAALTSPDLLYADAQRIVAEAEKELENTVRTTETARAGTVELPALESLRPFAA